MVTSQSLLVCLEDGPTSNKVGNMHTQHLKTTLVSLPTTQITVHLVSGSPIVTNRRGEN